MMPTMAMELKVDTDAQEVGFDAGRLKRIDRHFARHIDEGELPGWLIVVTRRGRVAHLSMCGHADIEAGRPVEVDTLWRIFSMTKPVTSVAAMMLFEEGAFDLTDPIARWLPEFTQPQVYVKGSALNPLTGPAIEPIRVWHLLTHTSGLTYGFHHAHPIDAMGKPVLRRHNGSIDSLVCDARKVLDNPHSFLPQLVKPALSSDLIQQVLRK